MKTCFVLLFLIMLLGCTNHTDSVRKENDYRKPPPPPLPPNEQKMCDSLKAIAYDEINRGEITIVFNDTITRIVIYRRFISILQSRLGFNYFRLDDVGSFQTLPHKYCVQPIMDSVIAAKYGVNGKDSIINEAYRLAEIEYKKNR